MWTLMNATLCGWCVMMLCAVPSLVKCTELCCTCLETTTIWICGVVHYNGKNWVHLLIKLFDNRHLLNDDNHDVNMFPMTHAMVSIMSSDCYFDGDLYQATP